MKRSYNLMKVTTAFVFLWIAVCAQAADCSKVVDKFCDTFGKMSVEVKKCKSVEDLEKLNFESVVADWEKSEFPDS